MYNKNDDLRSAIANNGLTQFSEEEIEEIVAEVTGANDELDWWWLLRLTNNRFALLHGGCDYTGWDCRSSLTVDVVAQSAEGAIMHAPEKDRLRPIRETLMKQFKGVLPFALTTLLTDDSISQEKKEQGKEEADKVA